jgi:hypothetical protein
MHNEARRIAANIAKLPETAANPSGPHLTSLTPIPGTLCAGKVADDRVKQFQ